MTSKYKMEITPQDRNIPHGKLRSGCFTSPATESTFVVPAYDTKTKPAVAKIELKPFEVILEYREWSTKNTPARIYMINKQIVASTIAV